MHRVYRMLKVFIPKDHVEWIAVIVAMANLISINKSVLKQSLLLGNKM